MKKIVKYLVGIIAIALIYLLISNFNLIMFKIAIYQQEIVEKITKNSKLKIALYDTKYYYNYDYDKYSLKIDKGVKAKVNFFTNDKIKFYFNLVSPEEYEVTFEWKI